MKYIDGFRDPQAAAALVRQIADLAATLAAQGRAATVMEVCGTHTMAIARNGIHDVLPPNVRLISGPGCPVCVTDPGYIDCAIELARRGATLVTFGDLLNVPGSDATLARARADGARVRVVYSPMEAIRIASAEPGTPTVFLAIGFETTVATVINLVPAARQAGIGNLSLLTAFKVVPPALRALLSDPEVKIDAFLCPAHVSAIIGSRAYEPFSGEGGVPCVVAGFEPLDILLAMRGILDQLVRGVAEVDNQYSRVVHPDGNRTAQNVIARHLAAADAAWRGIGTIPGSGLSLRSEFDGFDAARRFGVAVGRGREAPGCRCGDVIRGRITPAQCPLFGRRCTPDDAVGPCMVSSEGTCAAWYRYARKA